jgi:acylpyruvate hydrolase
MKLITLDLGERTAAAIALSENRARIFGSRETPDFEDVGELLRGGHLDDPGGLGARAGQEISYGEADLAAPILRPGAVFCVGLNYRSHILEMGRPLPPAPTIFDKLPRALTGPSAELIVPKAGAQALDYEGELCVVIGTGGRDIPADAALAHVAGFSVLNDITMRDFQQRSMQWFAGKSWQGLTPWGPALTTPDECADFDDLRLLVTVNGETRQQAALGDLVFGVADLVSDLSTIVELQPGDLIATGTPGGVGEAMTPKGYLTDGDVVEVSITGLGRVRNQISVR